MKTDIGNILVLENGKELLIVYDPDEDLFPYVLVNLETAQIENGYSNLDCFEIGAYIIGSDKKFLKIIEIKPFSNGE